MEIYKKLTEAVNSIDFRIIYWQFLDTDNIFDRNALLNIADQLDPIFDPEGLNYYMALPDGEILVLLMREKQIMSLFTPYEMKDKGAEAEAEAKPEANVSETEPAPKAAPKMKFCPQCGAPLIPGTIFCAKCGKKLAE